MIKKIITLIFFFTLIALFVYYNGNVLEIRENILNLNPNGTEIKVETKKIKTNYLDSIKETKRFDSTEKRREFMRSSKSIKAIPIQRSIWKPDSNRGFQVKKIDTIKTDTTNK